MLRPLSVRSIRAAPSLAAVVSLVVLFACQDNIPTEPEFARINNRYQVNITGTGSQAGGVVTSDRGGISCTVSSGGGVSGKCSQGYKSGAIVTLTLTPAAGAKLKLVSSNCAPSGDTGLACHVTVTGSMDVLVNFDAQSNTFALSISGGAAGSGSVSSNPSGITCTISNGSAGVTGCSFPYSLNQQVTVTATANSGSYLKAWAGGGCDATGTGVGAMSGTCVVVLSQAVSLVVSFDRPANAALLGQWDNSIISWPDQAVAIHANLLPDGRVMTWGRTLHQPVLWNQPPAASGAPLPSRWTCSAADIRCCPTDAF